MQALINFLAGLLNSAKNALNVQLSGSKTEDVIFQNAAAVSGNGTVFPAAGYKKLTVEIYGTSTSRTIAFVGRGKSGADINIIGVKLSDLSTASGTTGSGELWQFDVTGLVSVLMKITAVSGGNVTIAGRAVV